MINRELISIIMPCYNSGHHISHSIESVLKQTEVNWELLILDDGSTDNTLNVIENYCAIDNRIKSYPNFKNMGVSETRNKGIDLALGKWIAFLDSDDLWDKAKLRKQLEAAKKNNVDFVFTGSSFIDSEGKSYKYFYEVPKLVDYRNLRLNNTIQLSSVFIKKDYFKDIKIENDDIHEDYLLWLRILKKGGYAFGINEPLLTYRISKNSRSGNKFKSLSKTYKVFRQIDINFIASLYFTFSHLFKASIKYKKIYKK